MDFFYGFFVLLLTPEFYLPLRNMGTHYHARMVEQGTHHDLIQRTGLYHTMLHTFAKEIH